MKKELQSVFIGLVMLFGVCPTLSAVPFSGIMSEAAQKSSLPDGIPGPSDICFSSRMKHPQGLTDPYDSIATAKSFGSTRFVWSYVWGYNSDSNYVTQAKQMGCTFQAALNSYTWDAPGNYTTLKGRILDLNGIAVTAYWQRGWATPAFGSWGCVNSLEWRNSVLAAANKMLDIGATSFQFDDACCNIQAVSFGGCFCANCMNGFREYVRTNASSVTISEMGITNIDAFDYGAYLRSINAPVGDGFATYSDSIKPAFIAYQTKSVVDFFTWLRSQVDLHAGRTVLFSANNSNAEWHSPYDLFDYGVSELLANGATPAQMLAKIQNARKCGKKQLFTLEETNTSLTRLVIATSYAFGSPLIVPWDVYLPGSSARYYGTAAQYGDLYKFVRDQAGLLDGYEDAAFAGWGLSDARYPSQPPVSIIGAPKCCAIVRAVPGDNKATAVVHLVDWAENPVDFTIAIEKKRFSSRNLGIVLCRPSIPPVILNATESNGQLIVAIPHLNPWGILKLPLIPNSSANLRNVRSD